MPTTWGVLEENCKASQGTARDLDVGLPVVRAVDIGTAWRLCRSRDDILLWLTYLGLCTELSRYNSLFCLVSTACCSSVDLSRNTSGRGTPEMLSFGLPPLRSSPLDHGNSNAETGPSSQPGGFMFVGPYSFEARVSSQEDFPEPLENMALGTQREARDGGKSGNMLGSNEYRGYWDMPVNDAVSLWTESTDPFSPFSLPTLSKQALIQTTHDIVRAALKDGSFHALTHKQIRIGVEKRLGLEGGVASAPENRVIVKEAVEHALSEFPNRGGIVTNKPLSTSSLQTPSKPVHGQIATNDIEDDPPSGSLSHLAPFLPRQGPVVMTVDSNPYSIPTLFAQDNFVPHTPLPTPASGINYLPQPRQESEDFNPYPSPHQPPSTEASILDVPLSNTPNRTSLGMDDKRLYDWVIPRHASSSSLTGPPRGIHASNARNARDSPEHRPQSSSLVHRHFPPYRSRSRSASLFEGRSGGSGHRRFSSGDPFKIVPKFLAEPRSAPCLGPSVDQPVVLSGITRGYVPDDESSSDESDTEMSATGSNPHSEAGMRRSPSDSELWPAYLSSPLPLRSPPSLAQGTVLHQGDDATRSSAPLQTHSSGYPAMPNLALVDAETQKQKHSLDNSTRGDPDNRAGSSRALVVDNSTSAKDSFIESFEMALEQICGPASCGQAFQIWTQLKPIYSYSDLHRVATQVADVFLFIAVDRAASKALCRLVGPHAQVILDTLQMILDTGPSLSNEENCRKHLQIRYLLLGLAKRSCQYPKCLVLSAITREGDHAVTAGHFGEIWKGRFQGDPVCVKVVKVYARSDVDKLLKAFTREAILWSHLSHENVLPFYGIHRLDDIAGRMCLISPWMENGNIGEYLLQNPEAKRPVLASDVCSGLAYLHAQDIVHGDLKGANILVTRTGRACVADFGLSIIAENEIMRWTSTASAATPGGTVRWQAPELFNPEAEDTKSSKMSDVYALGCVFYEVGPIATLFYSKLTRP
ncbi:hypothetical protein D9611_000771 [Ephemerocybe angulata]|uniref:Protein kinase domain-containing protein n=1 Tax=Ephemerocybe angulata TaxID=980116 RepID=A0A8H5BN70_9AGAR|nr:hypothetical protein D9611_000771 [Tulosesus angulatus]